MFVGYNENSKGYLVLVPLEEGGYKRVTARSVTFDETEFFFKETRTAEGIKSPDDDDNSGGEELVLEDPIFPQEEIILENQEEIIQENATGDVFQDVVDDPETQAAAPAPIERPTERRRSE